MVEISMDLSGVVGDDRGGNGMVRQLLIPVLRRSPLAVKRAAYVCRGVVQRGVGYSGAFQRNIRFLRQSQWWSADRIREYQDARVRELIRHAFDTVPFYRRRLDEAGLRPSDIRTQDDLRLLPILTKQQVRENCEAMVSRRFNRWLLDARSTSGTTGTHTTMYNSHRGYSMHRALGWRARERFGARFGMNRIRLVARRFLFADNDRPPFWWRQPATYMTMTSIHHLTRPDRLAIFADWFCEQRFDVLSGWPSGHLLLANHLAETGKRPRHPLVLVTCAGETVLPAVRAKLGEVFNAPVMGWYDMTEHAGNLSECEHGRLHLDFETCCLETQPVPGSEGKLVRLIFTGWMEPAMPFIRYEVGDIGRPTAPGVVCPCGRQSLALDAVDGRTDDYVRTPDGRMVAALNVHLPSAREVQVYQGRLEEIEVRVVPGPRYDPGDEAEMVRRLRELLGEELGIRVVRMESIPRTGSGKFRAVLSDLSGATEQEQALSAASHA
jgi:phenylacetate-CoA ligase